MGSGTLIRREIKKYGLDRFEKIILFQFDTEQEMLNKEAELVNREFISREDTYNIIVGGGHFLTVDTITVKDKDGVFSRVHKSDPRYLSGELVHNTTGNVVVRDKDNNILFVKKDDPKYHSGELIFISKGWASVKDKDGKSLFVRLDDPRYLSGELVGTSKGYKHTVETKKRIGDANSLKQKGEGNSQYGTCWIYNTTGNRKIKKHELEIYLNNGWIRGRK
jgi:hypothetical protein